MSNQPFNHRKFPTRVPRRVGSARPVTEPPWSLLTLMLVLHGVVGLFLSAFSPPFWVWPAAFGGTLIQALALAGPRALSSLEGIQILLSRALTCVGTALSVVALGVAVGFSGTSDIDSIEFVQIGFVLFFINLGVLLLTAGCSLLIAYVGDRLLPDMGRLRCNASILSVCFLGLFIGGAFGLAIAS
ncbi:MAG: hypothetical protein ACFB14_03200 [Leptolyngbyaceae cyanobacterium]